VESGETLTSIAKKYRVTPGAIAAANDLEAGTGLEAVEKLIIPAARSGGRDQEPTVRYRVATRGHVGGIADQFSVTDGDIRRWNGLKGGKVSRGMVLRIYTVEGRRRHWTCEEFRKNAPKEAGEREREPRVKPGETLTGKRTEKAGLERKERGRIFCLQNGRWRHESLTTALEWDNKSQGRSAD